MKKLITSILFAFVSFSTMAQSGYETVLQQIEENNTTLAALRKQTEAQKLSNLTGLLPENPEVAFNHLWGKPSYIGNNMDFAVTQTFDFPAVYRHRSKIARLQNENIDLPYKTQRTETLLSAKQTCIELVYYNILAKEYENWLQNARFIADAYKIKLEKGEINIIEHNKAHLNLTAVQIEIAQIEAERAVLLAQLKRLNGGKEIAFSAESYPAAALPQNFETWYASIESKNPELQYAQKQIDIDMQQIKLTRAEGFPKFWAGYAGEIERDKSSHGVIVGLSIPLWENRNRVSEAKAQVQASEFALKDNKVQFYNKLQSQYLKASALRQNAQKFRQSLNENDNKPLLKKALDAGEISMLDYLSEVEYYYNIMNKVLEAERDFEIAAAQLWAMEL